MYVLFNGRYYLDKLHKPCERNKAHYFNTMKGATNFLASSLKSIQNLQYKPLEVEDIIEENNQESTYDKLHKQFDIDFFNTIDIDKYVIDYQNFLQQANLSKENLLNELINIDKEIQDILHAAEFYTLNASQGYKMYKMLHEARIKRRKIKDMILKSEIISESTLDDWLSGKVGNRINGLKNREYSPRVLQELFK